MKIPGIEREEDGSIVIEISPTMRLVILAGAMTLVGVVIWWIAIAKEQKEIRQISRLPHDIPRAEDFTDGPKAPDKLMEVESQVGVSRESLLNIESVSGANREELEQIFSEILSSGLPDLRSQETQLYDTLVERSAEIAPNRALRFYDMLEGGHQRAYSISKLYHRWIELAPAEALETAKLVEEPLRFQTLARDLPALAEDQPAKAFEAALLTRGDYFQHVEPDFVRPVIRIWGGNDFSAAREAALAVKDAGGRKEALQGLALAKLDSSSSWEEAYSWVDELPTKEDRLWTALTVVEVGIQKDPELVRKAVNGFPNALLRQHLVRQLDAKQRALEASEQDRRLETWQRYRSVDPYDYHGRTVILNTVENLDEREMEAIALRSRWRELAEKTFVADGRLHFGDVPSSVPQTPLVNLLARGDQALAAGKTDEARKDFVTYLHYNPGVEDVDPYLTRWSQATDTWLGNGATSLDEVTVSAATVPEGSDFFAVMNQLGEQYKKKTGKDLNFFIFEAISGRTPDLLFSWGEHGDVSLREALDALTMYSGLTIYHKEYGIVGYYWRDEDIATAMGSPLELIDYPALRENF